jgi:hypothetical protein
MTVAPTISPACLLQILFDIRWPRSVNLNVLLFKRCQEMASHRHASADRLRSVSFLFQVILKFRNPRLVVEVNI